MFSSDFPGPVLRLAVTAPHAAPKTLPDRNSATPQHLSPVTGEWTGTPLPTLTGA